MPIFAAASALSSRRTGAPRARHCRSRSFEFGEAARADRAMQRAGALDFAGDPVLVDELEHGPRRVAEQRQQPLAVCLAERRRQFVGHHPHAGVDQADVAPRAAKADLGAVEHGDRRAALSRVQRRGEAGVACADDGDVAVDVDFQPRRRRRRRGGFFPQAVAQRIAVHGAPSPRRGRRSEKNARVPAAKPIDLPPCFGRLRAGPAGRRRPAY